jgi:lipoprotein-anchoring transpeptidase ErfK/SrfK
MKRMSMKVESTANKVLSVVLSALMFAVSAAAVWAVVSDYATRDIVAKGAALVGHDLTGMTPAQVRATIDEYVSTPVMRPLTVAGDDKTWVLDPKGIVTVDTDAMTAEAYSPSRNATLVERLIGRVTDKPLPVDVKPVYSVDTSTLAGWVKQRATDVDRPPVNAKRDVVGHGIHITPAVYGATVEQTRAVDQISHVLTSDAARSSASKVASLAITVVTPSVVASSFGNAIVVSLSECRIRLFSGDQLVKEYPCAPGQPAWPTPKGDFKIVNKQANAPWINPNSAWSASMPPMIPGGPGNPMGDRKIAINVPGVFMHGIPRSEYGSIGSHASHGCMRMMPSAVHDLYGRVNIGDPVFIRN